MKIIIDINDDLCNVIQNYDGIGAIACAYQLSQIIKKGTPLPKGYGRIIDMDAAIKCIEDVEGDDAIWAISLIEWACGKRTIIEADKAESEEV